MSPELPVKSGSNKAGMTSAGSWFLESCSSNRKERLSIESQWVGTVSWVVVVDRSRRRAGTSVTRTSPSERYRGTSQRRTRHVGNAFCIWFVPIFQANDERLENKWCVRTAVDGKSALLTSWVLITSDVVGRLEDQPLWRCHSQDDSSVPDWRWRYLRAPTATSTTGSLCCWHVVVHHMNSILSMFNWRRFAC